jgi:hypothetical protein
VLGEAAADRNDEVGFREAFARDLAGETARDADREGVADEEAAGWQRGGEQAVAALRERAAGGGGAGQLRAAPGHDDHAAGASHRIRRAGKVVRMRRNRPDLRHQSVRRGGQRLLASPGRLLKVEGHADDDRPTLAPRLQEGVADAGNQPGRVVERVIGGPGRRDERGLVDRLVVPGCPQRRLAGEDDQRDAGAHGGGQRRHDLCEAGATSDGGETNVVTHARIRHGGGDGAVLVPHVDHPRAKFGEPRRKVHVGVAEQGEAGVDLLLEKRFGEDVVGLAWPHAAASWRSGAARMRAGTITSPRAISRAVRISPADRSSKPCGPIS